MECVGGVTIPFAGFYCSELIPILPIKKDGVTIPFAGFYCSEQFILFDCALDYVTIPFAGFYCSENLGRWILLKTPEVTIPFAGFYCSEPSIFRQAGQSGSSQSRSRDFIVLRSM